MDQQSVYGSRCYYQDPIQEATGRSGAIFYEQRLSRIELESQEGCQDSRI